MKKFVVAVALFAAFTGAAVVATSALAFPTICNPLKDACH